MDAPFDDKLEYKAQSYRIRVIIKDFAEPQNCVLDTMEEVKVVLWLLKNIKNVPLNIKKP